MYFNVDADNILTLVYPVAYMAREYDSHRTYTVEFGLFDISRAKNALVTSVLHHRVYHLRSCSLYCVDGHNVLNSG